jgi:hypothetical protein
MARDLKINIRKRAIGSFFEWDKLDRAAGGCEEVLGKLHQSNLCLSSSLCFIGTKLHQSTRKAISKRKPALMNAIRKYNKYCETLEALYNPEWDIPLPEPLPTQLAVLRDGSNLMEDVWITRAEGMVPRWLEDADVRDGIRSAVWNQIIYAGGLAESCVHFKSHWRPPRVRDFLCTVCTLLSSLKPLRFLHFRIVATTANTSPTSQVTLGKHSHVKHPV